MHYHANPLKGKSCCFWKLSALVVHLSCISAKNDQKHLMDSKLVYPRWLNSCRVHLSVSLSMIFGSICTGKSFSEALILASTILKFDDGLFIELQVQYNEIPSSEHVV